MVVTHGSQKLIDSGKAYLVWARGSKHRYYFKDVIHARRFMYKLVKDRDDDAFMHKEGTYETAIAYPENEKVKYRMEKGRKGLYLGILYKNGTVKKNKPRTKKVGSKEKLETNMMLKYLGATNTWPYVK